MKQILCMKWGDRYSADYVNRLYAMVHRHTTPPFRFICLTDDPAGIRDEVETLPCPTVPLEGRAAQVGWRKLTVWQPELYDLQGDILFLDLDVVIVDNIDELFTFGEDFCVMRNWTQPHEPIGNTSVFRFTVGAHPEVWHNFLENADEIMRRDINEQMYLSRAIKTLTFFPDTWCRLFKVHCVPPFPQRWFVPPYLPEGAKIIAFPGVPNPPDAAAGRWPTPWYKKFYKHIRPATWVDENWQ